MTPFDIDPTQIEQLGGGFGTFVFHLLDAERGAHGMGSHQLTFNKNETTPDGGVDAALSGATETSWLPPGDSAWQFKQSNPTAKACEAELAKATWAHEYLRNGGHYVMVQGRQLTDKAIKARLKALQDKAIALSLIANTDSDRARIRVYDANQLARWASQYPALTLDPLLRAPLGPLMDFDRWTELQPYQGTWVAEAQRTQIATQLVSALKTSTACEFRVEGLSGMGKTRLVMEALKDDELRTLVAYGPDATQITPEVISYLIGNERTAVLVVDECDRHTHDLLAKQLPARGNVRLVTIGRPDARLSATPLFVLGPMAPTDIETVLRENRPKLWVEARQFVSANCAGNVQMAYMLADHLLTHGTAHAAELMRRGDMEAIFAIVFPRDHDFYLMTALALFDRIGWDGELASELTIVATFCDTTVANLKRVGQSLTEQSLLETHGRYRAVAPSPVAVYLAARAWEVEGRRIVDELLPALSPQMLRALFARLADLGPYEPVSNALEQLLALGGLFGTLEGMERRSVGEFLVQLAIVMPEQTAAHIQRLVSSTPLEELRQQRSIRRSLVNALEKLAWHTTIFPQAADALLRLALAENEAYANNATGAWTSLFAMMLPATAAAPEQRLAYLREHVQDHDPYVRELVVAACAAGLENQEMVVVFAEQQEGAAVEPRGSARTYEEAAHYGAELIALLSQLADDSKDEVAQTAFKVFAEHLHPTHLNSLYGQLLQAALVALGPRFNRELRSEIAKAQSWATRASNTEFVAMLDTLLQNLPDLPSMDRLRALAALGSWEFDGPLKQEIDDAVAQVLRDDGLDAIIGWLSSSEVSAAWEVGSALAAATNALAEVRDALAERVKDPTALAGFLRACVTMGDDDGFDAFLDSEVGQALDVGKQLYLTMRAPASLRAKTRAVKLALALSPRHAAPRLVGWGHELEPEQVETLVQRWLSVDDQEEYNAAIDWLAFWAHSRDTLPEPPRSLIWQLLNRRIDFVDMGQKSWDWCELAKRFVASDAAGVADLVCNMVTGPHLSIAHREEATLLTECAQRDPIAVWSAMAPHLREEDWRLLMDLRGWFVDSIPVNTVVDWIGDSIERARIVTNITDPGDATPTELGRFLLTQFPGDEEIAESLRTQYMSGGWMGSWSNHLQEYIDQLEGWVRAEGASSPVGTWANGMLSSLKQDLRQVAQREAEER